MDIVKEGRPTPTTLSDWILVAVEDSHRLPEQCSTDELSFVLDMSTFKWSGVTLCKACFAGMAMLGTGLWRASLTARWCIDAAAEALNAVRAGDIGQALLRFLREKNLEESDVEAMLTPRMRAAAARVEKEARDAYLKDREALMRERDGLLGESDSGKPSKVSYVSLPSLVDRPTKNCRASDEAYLELAAALKEVGL